MTPPKAPQTAAPGSKRPLRPRPPVVVRPSFVSDETCFAVLGITPRKFRERVVPLCGPVTRLGHTICVELAEAERAMRSIATDDGEAIALA